MRLNGNFTGALLLLILLTTSLPVATSAQTLLGIPPQSSTFGMTRGYWFTAPVDITIVSVRVPTGVSGNYQSVQLLQLPAPPPSYSGNTNTFTSLLYYQNVNGTTAMPCAVPVLNGDIIMVLGARSTSNNTGSCTNTNSYGAYTGTSYPSSLCGTGVNLTRAGFQDHICRGSAYNVWQEPISNYYISRIELMYSCGLLPVELSTFSGEQEGETVVLNWETEGEEDFSHFEVQRAIERQEPIEMSPTEAHTLVQSSDGIVRETGGSVFVDVADWHDKEYETLEIVAGKGGEGKQTPYRFTDAEPRAGFNYYRLRKVDNNGEATYSNPIEIRYGMEESKIASIFPNPAENEVRLDFVSVESQLATMQIFDVNGRLQFDKQYTLSAGTNRLALNVSDWQSGSYFVKTRLAEGKSLTGTIVVR